MSGLRTKLTLCLVLVLGGGVFAQSRTDGIVSGEITDEFGALFQEVRITAKTRKGETFSTTSTLNGTYELRPPKGIYVLTFKRSPFKTFSVEDYQVSDGSRMKLDVSLICENCEPTDRVADVSVP